MYSRATFIILMSHGTGLPVPPTAPSTAAQLVRLNVLYDVLGAHGREGVLVFAVIFHHRLCPFPHRLHKLLALVPADVLEGVPRLAQDLLDLGGVGQRLLAELFVQLLIDLHVRL